jgi:dTDP-4-amino-4,6-dideoxygalactose transaminase
MPKGKEFGMSRDEVLKRLIDAGIGAAIFYPLLINEQKFYTKMGYRSDTPIAKKIAQQVLSLPVHPGLKQSDLNYIVKIFKKIAER